jgi:uncharacterized integral membrane protein
MSTPRRFDPEQSPLPPSGPVGPPAPSIPDQYTEPVAVGPVLPVAPVQPAGPEQDAPGLTPDTLTRKHSRAGAAWVALVVAAVVLIFLLVFVVQNSDPVQVRYFGFEGTLPLGVAMLFAAIAGALTAGLLGTVRILQLRSRVRRTSTPT